MFEELLLLENPDYDLDDDDDLNDDPWDGDDSLDDDDGEHDLMLVEANPWLENPKPRKRKRRQSPAEPTLPGVIALAGGVYAVALLLSWHRTGTWQWWPWRTSFLARRRLNRPLATASTTRPVGMPNGTGTAGSAPGYIRKAEDTPAQRAARQGRNWLDIIPYAQRSVAKDFPARLG